MGAEGVRGVLFDAGNTLIRVRGSVGRVYARVARRHGVEADGPALDRAFRAAFAQRKGSFLAGVTRPHSPERERAWWKALVRDVLRRTGAWAAAEARFDALFEELYAAFAEPEPWEVFPDVLPCLDALDAAGVPVAVVSNWDSRLRRVLAGTGLLGRFRFVLTSAEFGAEKPDPSIFLEAARRLGMPPAEILHAGDLIRDDVLGARRAGMRAVLVDRDLTAPDGWHRVRDLREIPALVSGPGG